METFLISETFLVSVFEQFFCFFVLKKKKRIETQPKKKIETKKKETKKIYFLFHKQF